MEASQVPAAEPNDPTAGEAAEQTEAQEAQAGQEGVQGRTITGSQGEQVPENPYAVGGASVGAGDPNVPVRQSPPPPQAQSGVPALAENEGVEPGEAGPTDGSGQGGTAGLASAGTPAEGGVAPTPPQGGGGE